MRSEHHRTAKAADLTYIDIQVDCVFIVALSGVNASFIYLLLTCYIRFDMRTLRSPRNL